MRLILSCYKSKAGCTGSNLAPLMLPLKVRSGVYLIASCGCYPRAYVMAAFCFGIMVLCGLFHYGSTIMCYECNSATNSMCLDAKLPDNLKRNCSDHDRGVTHTLCRKIVQHVDYGVNGRLPEDRVIRSCGWDETKYKGQCYHRAGHGGRQEVCSCLTDLCNGAQETAATSALLATTALMYIGKIMYQ